MDFQKQHSLIGGSSLIVALLLRLLFYYGQGSSWEILLIPVGMAAMINFMIGFYYLLFIAYRHRTSTEPDVNI